MWVSVSKVEYEKLSGGNSENPSYKNENSQEIARRVLSARKIQLRRFRNKGIENKKINSEMSVSNIEKCIFLNVEVKKLLTSSAERLGLSGRAFHRIIKVAQTIADLENKQNIEKEHILEALQYRQRF